MQKNGKSILKTSKASGYQVSRHGGPRRGSGRKPKPSTVLARLAIAELDEEAEKSIRFIVNVRDNPKWPKFIRFAAAQDLIDRRFGKPKQAVSVGGDAASPIIIEYVDAHKNTGAENTGL